jgi:hypothetical protein
MKTVRVKLVALVVACTAPALLGAVLRAREAETTLLSQATGRVDRVNGAFAAEMEDFQQNARLALVMTEHAGRFQQALASHDHAGAERLVSTLADVYKARIVVAADATGERLAFTSLKRAPLSLRPDASPAFADLLAG